MASNNSNLGWQRLYRALLRSSTASVQAQFGNVSRFHVDPRTKLGASVATNHALTHAQSQGADLDLHDASNSAHDALAHHGPVPIKASRLAHRTIANLSSLTYHHLSPYTQMQSRAHLKDNRALRKPKTLSSLARVLGKIDSSSSDSSLEAALLEGEDTVVNEAHMKIGFLYPSIKPKRGPVSGRLKEWNGQDAEKVVSEGVLAQMQMDLDTVERLLEEHNSATVGQGKGSKKDQSASKQVQKLKTEAEQLKKRIKTVTKALMQAIAQSDLESIPVGHLADLVAAAQDKERLLLGKNRWLRRKNGEFLPP
uniref:Uncharacterized protein n=1 Tax=Melanopsichium pennsylvanicum 4 TaxID=1398559 RepID=A0A077R399_9BASI|nr:putative protein [Melanopsichium pennsylvanicum 4]